jgi:hypothetical protein
MIRLRVARRNRIGPLVLPREPSIDESRHDACCFGVTQGLPAGDEEVIAIALGVAVGRTGAGAQGRVRAPTQQQFVDLTVREAEWRLDGKPSQTDVPDGHRQVECRDSREEVSVHLETRPAPTRQAPRGCGGEIPARHPGNTYRRVRAMTVPKGQPAGRRGRLPVRRADPDRSVTKLVVVVRKPGLG